MPQYQGIWTLAQAAQLQSTQRWATDPLFENTTLLLQADNAANGAQNNTFLDSSSNNFTITRNGNTTQGTFTPFSSQPGAWSNYFPGTSSLVVPAGSAFAYGTGAFTVEAWINPYTYQAGTFAGGQIFTQTTGGQNYFTVGIGGSGTVGLTFGSGGGTGIGTSFSAAPLGSWTHIAIVREGTGANQLKIYVNGVLSQTGTCSFDFTNTSYNPTVANYTHDSTQNPFGGYISNLRVVKGVAVYTGNFSPPTSPLTATQSAGTNIAAITGTQTSLLTCQSTRFIDNSVANSGSGWTVSIGGTPSVQAFSPFAPQYQYTPSVTGGSGYFDGSSDFLQTATTTSFAFGTGNFTIEGWVYLTAYNSGACLFGTTQGATTGYYVNLGGDVNSLRVTSNASGTWTDNITVSAGNGVRLNEWTHIALVRNAGSLILYKNGVNVASTSSAASWNFTSPNNAGYIGRVTNGVSTQDLAGWVTSVRVSNTARTITVPTTPYSSDANTVLLTNFTNAGIVDGTMKNNLETVGNAQVSTSVVKYGTGSMYFDGSGDGLILPASPFYNFLDGNFTVEAWVYIAGNSPLDGLSRRIANVFSVSTSSAFSFDFIIRGDGTTTGTGLEIYNGTNIVNVTGTISQSTWHHIAVTKSGTSVYFFLNGTQMGTTQTTSGNWGSATVAAQVGRAAVTSYTFDLNGYIDDLRITKFARYTSNFIPPSVALPRQ